MDKIFKRLEFVIVETDEIAKYFHKSERNEVMMFCMCMLDRLNFSSESLKILLSSFTSNTKVEYSCGIIIRSVILDYLIVLNAIEIFARKFDEKGDPFDELKEYCTMMLCDSVRHTLKDFDSLTYEVSKDDLKNMYANLVASNPECFEPYSNDGSVPVIKIKDFKSPKKLLNTLMTSKHLKKYANVFEIYSFYSKYDHFGQMIYNLSRKEVLEKLSKISTAVTVFPKILMFTLAILVSKSPSDSFLFSKHQKVVNFIEELEKN